MKKLLSLFLIAVSLPSFAGTYDTTRTIYLPGFHTYVASGYVPSERNIEFLKELKGRVSTFKFVTFDTSKNNSNMLLCRASFPVYGPNRTPFATLVEAAANLELAESGLVSSDAPRIQATLDEFDFSSFGTGKWTIRATFTSDGIVPLVVKYEYVYKVSAGAVAGCADVMNAMPSGIESFLHALYSDPRFIEFAQ